MTHASNTGVNFADVAGVDGAKDERMQVVDFPKHRKEYGRLARHGQPLRHKWRPGLHRKAQGKTRTVNCLQ